MLRDILKVSVVLSTVEPPRGKTNNVVSVTGTTQAGLYSHRKELEA